MLLRLADRKQRSSLKDSQARNNGSGYRYLEYAERDGGCRPFVVYSVVHRHVMPFPAEHLPLCHLSGIGKYVFRNHPIHVNLLPSHKVTRHASKHFWYPTYSNRSPNVSVPKHNALQVSVHSDGSLHCNIRTKAQYVIESFSSQYIKNAP